MKALATLLATLAFLPLISCGDSVGEPCQLTTGALGFGFDDPCKTKCLQLTDITCPDGSVIRKAVCAGPENCSPGSCPDEQACYSLEDPFEQYFYCLPADFCGPGLEAEQRLAWERESRRRSDAIREKFAERARRRTGKPTAPAPSTD